MKQNDGAVAEPVEAVVFDLGGVLMDFDFDRANLAAARVSGLSADEVRRRLFSSPDFLAFERGHLTPQDFHTKLQNLLGIQMPYALFCDAWNGIFKGEIEPTVTLLRGLRSRVKVGVLSNTNVIHFEYLRVRMGLLTELDHVYASHEIGSRKPNAECFHHVLGRMGVSAKRTVFVDDLLENIEAAQVLGMRGIHAVNSHAVQNGLRELGLI